MLPPPITEGLTLRSICILPSNNISDDANESRRCRSVHSIHSAKAEQNVSPLLHLRRHYHVSANTFSSLETWISVGGWSFNDDTNSPNTRTAFSDMASTAANRQTFIRSLMNFMSNYGFDGVDIDWEYPGADDRGGKPADTQNFVALLKEMRAAFAGKYGQYPLNCDDGSPFL